MLQKLRDQTQGTGFKVLVVAIILVLTLFGFGATNMFLAPDPTLAEVGDFEITQNVLGFETEREKRRLLARMGPEFDPSSIDPLQLQDYALQQLINRQVFYQTAERLGLAMSEQAVNEELLSAPAYQIDGKFDEQIYRQQVQALGYTPVDFVAEFTSALTAEQMRDAVMETAVLPDWELAEIVRVVNQRRDIAYLPLTRDMFMDRVEVSEQEIARRYEENSADYMTPLRVDVSYITLNIEDLAQDTSIEVSEQELQEMYEDERQSAMGTEQRDSSHILVQIDDDRSADEALAAINEVAERLADGESFESLAEEVSEDPGSAANGGSLGPVGVGVFDPAFEQALWALEGEGSVSEPVQSSFGYHLIRLDGVIVPEYPSLEERRAELEQQIRIGKAAGLFSDLVLELERSVYDERSSLAGTAQEMGLEVATAQGVARGAEADDPVLSEAEVQRALFSDDVLAGDNSEPIEVGEGQVVVVRVDQQYPPELMPLEQVTERIQDDIRQEKALAAIEKAKADGLQRLQDGEPVGEIASDLGGSWQSRALVARAGAGGEIPRDVLSAAFELPRPAPGQKSIGVAQLPDGAALVTVTRVVQGSISTTTDAEVAQFRRMSEERVARMDYTSFIQAAEQALDVQRTPG